MPSPVGLRTTDLKPNILRNNFRQSEDSTLLIVVGRNATAKAFLSNSLHSIHYSFLSYFSSQQQINKVYLFFRKVSFGSITGLLLLPFYYICWRATEGPQTHCLSLSRGGSLSLPRPGDQRGSDRPADRQFRLQRFCPTAEFEHHLPPVPPPPQSSDPDPCSVLRRPPISYSSPFY